MICILSFKSEIEFVSKTFHFDRFLLAKKFADKVSAPHFSGSGAIVDPFVGSQTPLIVTTHFSPTPKNLGLEQYSRILQELE